SARRSGGDVQGGAPTRRAMIEVRIGELADARESALLRPIDANWGAVTPATRRLELAAGPALADQCRRLGELPVGSAVITGAGELAAEFMVHVVVRSIDEPVSPAGVRRGLVKDRKSTRLNSSHVKSSYAVFCL